MDLSKTSLPFDLLKLTVSMHLLLATTYCFNRAN